MATLSKKLIYYGKNIQSSKIKIPPFDGVFFIAENFLSIEILIKNLADENANVVKLEHNQALVTNSFKKALLGVTVETNNLQHIERIIKALNKHSYAIEKIDLLR